MNENIVLKDNNGDILDPKIPHLEAQIIKNENGTAIKYANGRLECFSKIALTDFPGSNDFGVSLARSNTLNFPDFPVKFTEVPKINFQVMKTDASGWIGYMPGSDFKPSVNNPGKPIYVKIAKGNFNAEISYFATGKWK